MYQWNLNIQQEIFPGTAATIGYVGNRGINQMNQVCVNSATATNVNGRLVLRNQDRNRPNQASAFRGLCLLQQQAASDAWHHGLQMGLERRFLDGFQLQISYTFSRTVNEADEVNGLYLNDGNAVNYYPDPDLYRGLAAYHVGRVFSTSGVWQLPFGNNLDGAAGKILGGWQLSGIVSLADGPPTTLEVSRGGLSTALKDRAQTPDLAPGNTNNNPNEGTSIGCSGVAAGTPLGTPALYYDPCAFTDPPRPTVDGQRSRGTLGNVGRSTLITPGVANVDLSLTKNTRVGEHVNVQFRTEFFNIFNRANHRLPNERIDESSAGRIDETTLTNRQIQFGLRIEF